MKKYLIKIALFFVAIAVVDVLFGIACQYMNDHSKGGGIKSRYYVCKESNEDVLVFGSSRAKHHYVPDIIEDSLGMTCYNTGEDGNGIILCYGFLKMITERRPPRLIIYDVSRFDIYEDDNMKYLDLLKPYYYEAGIDSLFWEIEPKTRVMMLSNLYRFNTTCIRVFGSYFYPVSNYPNGYLALTGTMNYDPEYEIIEEGRIDNQKLFFFEKFVLMTQSRDISLVCCVSPLYNANFSKDFYKPIEQLCEEYNIPFLNYEFLSGVSEFKDCFQDRTHLNDRGAQLFTRNLMMEINNLLNNNK